jgi:hypothetical protein
MSTQNIQVTPEHSVNPAPTTIIATTELVAIPNESWTLDQLAAYARAGFQQSDDLEGEAKLLFKRLQFTKRTSGVAYFRAGQALCIARELLKAVLIACTIFQKGKTEEEVSRYSLAQLKKMYCRDPKPVNSPTPPPAIAKKTLKFAESVELAAAQLTELKTADVEVAEVETVRAKLLDIMNMVSALLSRVSSVQTPVDHVSTGNTNGTNGNGTPGHVSNGNTNWKLNEHVIPPPMASSGHAIHA